MAYLLDLPNELLYKICSFISGEELKTFCASNRQIYNVSKPIMATHRALWAKFEVLVDTPNTSAWFWHNLTTSLLSGSPGAPYIREIRTEHFEQQGVFNGDPSNDAMFRDWDIASDSEILKPLQRLGGLSRRLRPAFANDPPSFEIINEVVRNKLGLSDIERRKWIAGIRRGEITAILFPLLPNLQTLKIEASSSIPLYFLGNAMKDAALAHHLKRPCEAFGKLTSVDLTSNGQEFDMDFLATIMALPSMRKIAASKVAAGQFTRKYELPASNVTEIAFLSQDISPDSFVDLIQGGPPLLSIHIGSWGFPQFYDEGMFGKMLLANAQDSLQTLQLLRDTVRGSKDGIKLQNFNKLENITISYESLCRGSMVDFLPSSLRRFTLHAVRYHPDIPKYLLELLGLKEERLPNLERLKLDLWLMDEDTEALSTACRNQRVVFDSVRET